MRIKTTLFAILVLALLQEAAAQVFDSTAVGIHQAESEFWSRMPDNANARGVLSREVPWALKSRSTGELTHKVFGWHPYWAKANAYQLYDYEALTHIAFFSYEVDTASGGYTTLRGWDTTPIISYAHLRGVKVILTVTNFGSQRNTELLTDTAKQWTLINTLITQLQSRNGDGVNFDFETVPAAQKANMVSFCRRAVRGIKAAIPSAEISFATPAVNWSEGWDLGALAGICDYLIMMGYNYYWSGSATAGPVAPVSGENYHIVRSINEDYLDAGVPPGKLLMGVPWYGYDWPVTSSARKAATTGTGTSRVYSAALALAASQIRVFDDLTGVPWVSYEASGWRQMWYDDSLSLQIKSNLAKELHLAGIGIWALSYEDGRPELWKGLKTAFLPNYTSAGSEITDDPQHAIRIVPNPVIDIFTIHYTVTRKSHISLMIYDIQGRLAYSAVNKEMDPGSWSAPFDANTLAPGVYVCVLQSRYGRSASKFAVIEPK